MVPGNLGFGDVVLATTTTLAPSRATLNASILPIPREAPVITIVFPFKKGLRDFAKAALLSDPASVNILKELTGPGHAMSTFSCQWDDCTEKFTTLQKLQDHLFRHVNEAQPIPGSKFPVTKTDTKTLPMFSIENTDDLNNSKGKEKVITKDKPRTIQNVKLVLEQKEDDDLKCEICKSGKEATGNLIVICDGCDRGFHQLCHDPNIPGSLLRIPNSKWFCNQCL